MRRGALTVVCALALGLAACGGDAATTRCTNAQAGFAVAYPENWFTSATPAPCSYFDAQPLSIPPGTEFFDAAVSIRREPVPYRRVLSEDRSVRVVESEDVDVDGRPAIRRTTVTTGEAMLPPGTRAYQYLVDLGDETLIAETFALKGHDFEADREVLDEMVGTVELR